MAVPGYQSVMLPLLRFAGDEKEHTISEAVDALALHFKLIDDDRKELLSSGLQTRFGNRVGWARTYLKKARLLESTGRGAFLITQRGLELLKTKPPEINAKSLRKFPEFTEFMNLSSQGNRHDGEETKVDQTP
ncbi:MAG: winged helix-turn-helix domain-containing protein, partial [Dehalococcoidia bacterium]|nr:winged helix-turn-helix domain-containing protein [Dehalococcoidia bacterium]